MASSSIARFRGLSALLIVAAVLVAVALSWAVDRRGDLNLRRSAQIRPSALGPTICGGAMCGFSNIGIRQAIRFGSF